MPYGMSQTIIVSNRLPVIVKKIGGKLEYYPGVGGLASAVASFSSKRNSIWIGWPGIVSDELTEAEERAIARKLRTMRCLPVFLTKKQLDEFYNGYSNNILWPLFHNLPTDLPREMKDFKAYQEVNEQYCDAVLSVSTDQSDIWVHDYQLLLLPRLLRDQHAGDNIGFFLHIPWPDAKQLMRLKHAEPLLKGVLGADLAGFHTQEYAQDFLGCAAALKVGTPADGGVALKNRVVRVTDFPIGIDYAKFAATGRTRAVHREVARLRRKYRNRRIILTVDRLDPTKGFLERLDAYETFLRESPELWNKVVMVMIAVPSRGEIDAYKQLKLKVERKIRAINKSFGTTRWRPIDYMHTSVNFEELNALYNIADVCFVAPIKDGMNLVAKEYVASHSRKDGVLILSRTAGASKELKDALLVNTNQPTSLVRGLKRALTMPKKELRTRVTAMQAVVSKNTAQVWAGNFMNSLKKAGIQQPALMLTTLKTKQLLADYGAAQQRLLVLDYDGVLMPFASRPEQAVPTAELKLLLGKLGSQPNTDVAIISGRGLENLEAWLGDLPLTLMAEHGAVARTDPKAKWQPAALAAHGWRREIKPILEKFAQKAPGAFVEEKGFSLVWHYRQTTPYYAQKNIVQIKYVLRPLLKKYGLKLYMGNKILEIKRPEIHKGAALRSLLNKPYDFMLVMGDDYTDEDMFRAAPKSAYTVKVGTSNTRARWRLRGVSQVHALLNRLT